MYSILLAALVLDGIFLSVVILMQAGKGGGLAAVGGSGGGVGISVGGVVGAGCGVGCVGGCGVGF